MAHWVEQYTGQPWTPEQDCFYWFVRISREQFGRDIPGYMADHARLVHAAARALSGDLASHYPCQQTATPHDGDAALLTQHRVPHHIGMVVWLKGKLHVLHALQNVGVVCSDRRSLQANGWHLAGFWTPLNKEAA
ncbi:hypothetical protein [Megalodesulfovibrio paquesii]